MDQFLLPYFSAQFESIDNKTLKLKSIMNKHRNQFYKLKQDPRFDKSKTQLALYNSMIEGYSNTLHFLIK